jgi:hypothetical protein
MSSTGVASLVEVSVEALPRSAVGKVLEHEEGLIEAEE